SGNEEVLRSVGANVHIVCRDRRSYEHVTKHAADASVQLLHDVALYLDIDRLMATTPAAGFLPAGTMRRRIRLFDRYLVLQKLQLRWDAIAFRDYAGTGRTLRCFRNDKESAGHPHPTPNLDISKVLKRSGLLTPDVAARVARRFLHIIGRADKVWTDRLHVAIAGGMLGIPTVFFPGNYFKNRAVFEFSLQQRFPNVDWREW
ncbi:MAG: polysaccharide pyruvyl transferase family protein, partial [Chloroflexota bacterium]